MAGLLVVRASFFESAVGVTVAEAEAEAVAVAVAVTVAVAVAVAVAVGVVLPADVGVEVAVAAGAGVVLAAALVIASEVKPEEMLAPGAELGRESTATSLQAATACTRMMKTTSGPM